VHLAGAGVDPRGDAGADGGSEKTTSRARRGNTPRDGGWGEKHPAATSSNNTAALKRGVAELLVRRVCVAPAGRGVEGRAAGWAAGSWTRAACQVLGVWGLEGVGSRGGASGKGRVAVGVLVERVVREREITRQRLVEKEARRRQRFARIQWEEDQWLAGSCPFHINAFVECGFGGITREDCSKRGCCYDESSPHRCSRARALTRSPPPATSLRHSHAALSGGAIRGPVASSGTTSARHTPPPSLQCAPAQASSHWTSKKRRPRS